MTDQLPPPQLPTPPRVWLTLLMGGILLVSGMVMGAGGSVLFLKHRFDQPDHEPKHFSDRLAKRMTRDLDLSEEQSEKIHSIFKAHQEEMHTIRLQIKDEIDTSFEGIKSEVKAVLTPEQIEKWERRIHEYRDRPAHDEGGRGRGPGGRGPGGRNGEHRKRDGHRDGPSMDDQRRRHNGPPEYRRPPHERRDGEHPPPPPRDGQAPPPETPQEQ